MMNFLFWVNYPVDVTELTLQNTIFFLSLIFTQEKQSVAFSTL